MKNSSRSFPFLPPDADGDYNMSRYSSGKPEELSSN